MCYSPPGPRCSHHSHQEMMKALIAAQEENNPNRKLILQERYENAQKIFYSTPRGQNELRRDIAVLTREVKTHPELESQLTDLKLNFQNGQILRKNQLIAYKVSLENRNSSIKETLGISNKQTLASAIAFNDILSLSEHSEVEAHITSPHLIKLTSSSADQNILCLHQKFQTTIEVAKTEGEDLVLAQTFDSAQASEIAEIFKKYHTYTSLPYPIQRNLQKWVQSWLLYKKIALIANVDTRTETTQYLAPHELFQHYLLGFKLKRKLGGTTAYRHGRTQELEDAITGTTFSGSTIEHVVTGNTKQTYLMNSTVTTDLHHGIFYFAPQRSDKGELFYEVRTTHQSTQYNVILTLQRIDKVLTEKRSQPLQDVLTTQFVRD